MMVDLRSDTVTRPCPKMRQAIAEAPVGDMVFGDDPMVNRLEATAAELLGKEAALFMPSGTMTNQVAIRLHTQPGDEAVFEAGAHPYNFEAGAAAMVSGVTIRPVPSVGGILNPADVQATFRPVDHHFAPVTLVAAENTANRGGGSVYPLDVLDAVADVAHKNGAAAHLDGARLFNAQVACGVEAARLVQGYDTISICLSKGLGAPVGSVLVGPAALLDERGKRMRKGLGGTMRQAGFLAAAGLFALENNIERLAEDHARAQALARGLTSSGYTVPEPPTNMVFLEVKDAPDFANQLEQAGVLCCAVGPQTLRLVTHLDVDDKSIDHAVAAFTALADGALKA